MGHSGWAGGWVGEYGRDKVEGAPAPIVNHSAEVALGQTC